MLNHICPSHLHTYHFINYPEAASLVQLLCFGSSIPTIHSLHLSHSNLSNIKKTSHFTPLSTSKALNSPEHKFHMPKHIKYALCYLAPDYFSHLSFCFLKS